MTFCGGITTPFSQVTSKAGLAAYQPRGLPFGGQENFAFRRGPEYAVIDLKKRTGISRWLRNSC